MPFTALDWHRRFTQQARWTRELRRYTLQQLDSSAIFRILEVGCGTGAILSELKDLPGADKAKIHGLDLNLEFLSLAARFQPSAHLAAGDGYRLPYPVGCFDLTCCHYLLLWVQDPLEILVEMKRVTRQGGWVVAFAEPDYGGRIDYPEELGEIGTLQMNSLARQGTDPRVGRKLKAILSEAGLKEIEVGILGGKWKEPPPKVEIDLEWKVLREDLEIQVSKREIERYERIDRDAWQSGTRLLFVPTFYAWGKA
jgi:ubiquinone/menaquinone biosynthesis C-methylase UbiE